LVVLAAITITSGSCINHSWSRWGEQRQRQRLLLVLMLVLLLLEPLYDGTAGMYWPLSTGGCSFNTTQLL
jgi:hypothetical protein